MEITDLPVCYKLCKGLNIYLNLIFFTQQPFTPGDENKLLRERLAHRYVYTSSTQR